MLTAELLLTVAFILRISVLNDCHYSNANSAIKKAEYSYSAEYYKSRS